MKTDAFSIDSAISLISLTLNQFKSGMMWTMLTRLYSVTKKITEQSKLQVQIQLYRTSIKKKSTSRMGDHQDQEEKSGIQDWT